MNRRGFLRGVLAMAAGGLVRPEAVAPLRRYWALGALPGLGTSAQSWTLAGATGYCVMAEVSVDGMAWQRIGLAPVYAVDPIRQPGLYHADLLAAPPIFGRYIIVRIERGVP